MITTAATEEVFNSAEFLANRNAAEANRTAPKPAVPAKPAEEPAKPVVAQPAAPAVDDDGDDDKPGDKRPEVHLSRSQRREMNRLRETAAEERGRRMALEAMIQNGGKQPVPAKDANAEPAREDFKTDAEYAAAVARHAAKAEVGKTAGESQIISDLREQISAAAALQADQVKVIPDWDKIMEKAEDLEFGDQIPVQIMFATSDVRAHMIEYFVSNPKDWEKLISLKDDEIQQRRLFARIEGKVESVYNERVKAAQAASKEPAKETPKEDRTNPAEAQAGRTAASAGKDTRLPKPSSEVAAKGGSAPPVEPEIGSPAWMDLRNRAQYTTRF